MIRVLLLALLVALVPVSRAFAACPGQTPTVDVSDGSASLCVPATPTAPITRVDVTFTAGSVQQALNFGPPSGQSSFDEDFVFSIAIPEELRGDGSASLSSTGPGGTSEVASAAVTFRPFDRPAAPVLLAD